MAKSGYEPEGRMFESCPAHFIVNNTLANTGNPDAMITSQAVAFIFDLSLKKPAADIVTGPPHALDSPAAGARSRLVSVISSNRVGSALVRLRFPTDGSL